MDVGLAKMVSELHKYPVCSEGSWISSECLILDYDLQMPTSSHEQVISENTWMA